MARHLQATGTWSPTEHAPSVLLNRLLVNVKLPVMLLLLPGLTFGRAVIVRFAMTLSCFTSCPMVKSFPLGRCSDGVLPGPRVQLAR